MTTINDDSGDYPCITAAARGTVDRPFVTLWVSRKECYFPKPDFSRTWASPGTGSSHFTATEAEYLGERKVPWEAGLRAMAAYRAWADYEKLPAWFREQLEKVQ